MSIIRINNIDVPSEIFEMIIRGSDSLEDIYQCSMVSREWYFICGKIMYEYKMILNNRGRSTIPRIFVRNMSTCCIEISSNNDLNNMIKYYSDRGDFKTSIVVHCDRFDYEGIGETLKSMSQNGMIFASFVREGNIYKHLFRYNDNVCMSGLSMMYVSPGFTDPTNLCVEIARNNLYVLPKIRSSNGYISLMRETCISMTIIYECMLQNRKKSISRHTLFALSSKVKRYLEKCFGDHLVGSNRWLEHTDVLNYEFRHISKEPKILKHGIIGNSDFEVRVEYVVLDGKNETYFTEDLIIPCINMINLMEGSDPPKINRKKLLSVSGYRIDEIRDVCSYFGMNISGTRPHLIRKLLALNNPEGDWDYGF